MDQYRLQAGVLVGEIDDEEYGTVEIRGGKCDVADYETAAALVRRYTILEWPDDDPGPPEHAGPPDDKDAGPDQGKGQGPPDHANDGGDGESDEDDESDEDEDEDVGEDENGDVAIELETEDNEEHTCAGADGECSRAVDGPDEFCWQHED